MKLINIFSLFVFFQFLEDLQKNFFRTVLTIIVMFAVPLYFLHSWETSYRETHLKPSHHIVQHHSKNQQKDIYASY